MKKAERIYRQAETSEKALERSFVKRVKELGLVTLKNQDPLTGGMPDRLVVLPGGKVLWVEFKSAGKKPTALQELQISRLRGFGHAVMVVDSRETWEMAEAFVRTCGNTAEIIAENLRK